MSDESKVSLLSALLESWNRNSRILVNLLEALPPAALHLRPADGSPSVAELFAHIHYVRLVFVSEDAPECILGPLPEEWTAPAEPARMAQRLNQSADVVRRAVESRLAANRPMDSHFDHPVFLIQHMIWHEGYHHGQIKLTLKQAGLAMPDNVAGPLTWRIWMNKSEASFN